MTSTKNIFKVTYPIFLTLLAQNVVNVTDTAFLGRVGEVELGASAIAGVLYFAVFMIGFGFSQGAQILIGRRNGEKNYQEIGPIFNNGLFFNISISLIILLLSMAFIPHLMKYLVSSNQVYEATIEYLDWRIYGYLFAFANVIFRSLYVGITQTKVLTASAIIMASVNVVLDYALIFGHWGFPKMGIGGAALASVIAEASSLIYLIYHTIRFTDIKKYGLFRLKKIDWKVVAQTLDLSIFIMFQYFVSISTWFLFFLFIERMGERALAATNIGRSLYILLMIPGSALSTTVNTLVSNLIGSGMKEKVLPFVNKVMGLALLFVTPLLTLTFFFPELFARIYTDDAGLIAYSIPVMKVVSIAMIFCAVSNIIFNAVSGTGNTRTAFAIEMITLVFYISFVYYTAIVNPSTVAVVWMSELIYWICIGTLCYTYLLKGNWRSREI